MDNKNTHINEHDLLKYISGESSKEEIGDIEKWLVKNPEKQKELKALERIWLHSSRLSVFDKINIEKDWNNTESRMNLTLDSNAKKVLHQKSIFHLLLRIAASVALLISLIYITAQYFVNAPQLQIVTTADFKKTVDLPDGSVVLLNAYSELTYPEKFTKNVRNVELNGEAYFEVTKNSENPFIINTNKNASVKVLGTSFNVNASSQTNEVIVLVVDGKVSLYQTDHEDNQVFLEKDETGILKNNLVSKSGFLQDNTLSWKTGILIFENTSLYEVVKDLIHHYNTPIVLNNIDPENYRVTATFDNQSLLEALEELMVILDLEYAVKNDTIQIYEKP